MYRFSCKTLFSRVLLVWSPWLGTLIVIDWQYLLSPANCPSAPWLLMPHTFLIVPFSDVNCVPKMSDWPRKRLDLTSRSCCKFFCLHNSGPVPSFHPCPARCLCYLAAGSVLCSVSSSDWSIAPSLGLWLASWQPGQCKHCHIPAVPSSGSLHIFLAITSLPSPVHPDLCLLSTDIARCLLVSSWCWHLLMAPDAAVTGPRVSLLTQIRPRGSLSSLGLWL